MNKNIVSWIVFSIILISFVSAVIIKDVIVDDNTYNKIQEQSTLTGKSIPETTSKMITDHVNTIQAEERKTELKEKYYLIIGDETKEKELLSCMDDILEE